VNAPLERFALSFGRVAELYDAARPDYPPEAIERAVAGLGLGHDAEVVDLAAGTGKLTRALVERFARVVAVEPDDRMRAVLEAVTPGVIACAGTAERTSLAERSADAVFVADAFHWFAGEAALNEIARILRPRGGLTLLWNNWWKLEPPFPDAAREALEDVFPRTGRRELQPGLEEWRRAFEGAPFEDLRTEQLEWELELPAEHVASLYLTPSAMAALPEGERAELREILEQELSGTYRLPIETGLYWTRLRL
jgi:SAM-dependent methyltransferase